MAAWARTERESFHIIVSMRALLEDCLEFCWHFLLCMQSLSKVRVFGQSHWQSKRNHTGLKKFGNMMLCIGTLARPSIQTDRQGSQSRLTPIDTILAIVLPSFPHRHACKVEVELFGIVSPSVHVYLLLWKIQLRNCFWVGWNRYFINYLLVLICSLELIRMQGLDTRETGMEFISFNILK